MRQHGRKSLDMGKCINMHELISYDQLLKDIKEHPEFPYVILDLFPENDEEVDLWCSQHTTSAFKLGEPVYRLVRGKTAYELPDMKQVGWKIKDRLQKDLRGTSFEVHSNLRFKI